MTQPNQSGDEAVRREPHMILQEPSYQEASAACITTAMTIGRTLGRSIFAHAILLELEPSAIEGIVRKRIDDLSSFLLKGGADPHDAEIAAHLVYIHLVEEGARLSRIMMIWSEGSA